MSGLNTITVKNIASATSDKEIKDFFSFCGKISDIQVTADGDAKAASVTFEQDTAAKTALLLNNTQLGPSHIAVTGAAVPEEHSAHPASDGSTGELTQEEKPRARIFAEYLAHGYMIGDAAVQRAVELDHKHGVSTRFANTLQTFDAKYHATDRAKVADQSYGLSQRANSLLTGLGSYFEKATNTPTGRRVVDFYTQGQRQVKDVHEEARRLAELKKQEHGGSAYKAAGLDRLFGSEKNKTAAAAPPASAPDGPSGPATAATPAATTATTTDTTTATSTTAPTTDAPKFDPPPTKPVA